MRSQTFGVYAVTWATKASPGFGVVRWCTLASRGSRPQHSIHKNHFLVAPTILVDPRLPKAAVDQQDVDLRRGSREGKRTRIVLSRKQPRINRIVKRLPESERQVARALLELLAVNPTGLAGQL